VTLKYRATEIDVLADVIGRLRLRSRIFCRSEFSEPWAMSLPAGDYAHFHVVERGGGWIRLEGQKQALALTSGDLVIVPHGGGHVIGSSPKAKPVPLASVAVATPSSHAVVRHGGGGAETQMLCGAFEFDRPGHNPILAVLPPMLYVRSFGTQSAEWLDPLLKLLSSEARHPRQGTETILTRLTDVIFVQAVRAWLEEQPAGTGGWLGALRDPQIGVALARMHSAPEKAWTVASLAAEVGMSRSPFAARFKVLVGLSPLAYLGEWRMQIAASLMRTERLSVGELADRVGYASEPAFSKAFKRFSGLSPRAFRSEMTSEEA